MDASKNIPDKNYYFLICDVPAIDAGHRIDQLNHMGFIADGNKENMVNYFQRFSKSKEPVLFIFQNKIRNLSAYMDQAEFNKLGIEQSYDRIPRLKLSELMKQQFEDMEFVGYNSLELLPEHRKTVRVCREAVRIDPYNIRHIPEYMLSQEIMDSTLRSEGNTLQYIPQERLNAGICRKAVENDYMSLQYVPFKFKSEELCRLAVNEAVADTKNENYRVLAHIPYTFICNEAIRQFNRMSVSAEAIAKTIVNKEVMSPNMCDKLFEWDHNAYKHFPHLYKSKEMTEKAIASDGALLAYAPPKQVNEELCLAAIKNTHKAMEFVPSSIKTPDFCLKAVQTDGNALEFIPPAYRSKKMCETALNNTNGYDLIKSIPYPDLCLQIIDRSILLKQLPDCIKMLPDGIMNKDIAHKIAEHAPDCLPVVPQRLRTKELYSKALKNDPLAIKYIPDDYKTKEACLDAIKRNPQACLHIPEKLKHDNFYSEIVKLNNLAFKYIPKDKITPEICLIAVKENALLKNIIPLEIKNCKNIYSFNERLERLLTDKDIFTFNDIRNLYLGNPLIVNEVKNGEKLLKNRILSYCKKADKFQILALKSDKKIKKGISI